jgi:hypothetical protein
MILTKNIHAIVRISYIILIISIIIIRGFIISEFFHLITTRMSGSTTVRIQIRELNIRK